MVPSKRLILLAAALPSLGGPLFATAPPRSAFDLSHWNLTLPTGKRGRPDVVSTAQLTAGYASPYFYFERDALVFWCPVDGVTTKGTTYPRSELRETRTDGQLFNWHATDGTATLKARVAVIAVPSTGRLTVGQIHDDGTGGIKSEPLLKLVYQYDGRSRHGKLVAQIRPRPGAKKNEDHTVARDLALDEPFSYEIELGPALALRIDVNGKEAHRETVNAAWKSQGLYFKAGSYLEDNKGSANEGGRVAFYELSAAHKR